MASIGSIALGQTVVSCGVGDILKVCPPADQTGLDITKSYISLGHYNDESVRGFRVGDTSIGSLEVDVDNEVCVKYTHNTAGYNTIEFMDVKGLVSYLHIDGSVRIHDHASIGMGGPAYGTYFSETDLTQEGD